MLGNFTLRSGATSDRYFDKYRITSDPALLEAVGERLDKLRMLHARVENLIVAPAVGAVPLAVSLSLRSNLPYVIARVDAPKQYGTGNSLEGPVTPGAHALLVEDVITSGSAALEALWLARKNGLIIEHALCLLDRNGGGREALAEQGVRLTPVLTAEQFDAAADRGIGSQVGAQ
jgi:orotate phosphoribosyltransferase